MATAEERHRHAVHAVRVDLSLVFGLLGALVLTLATGCSSNRAATSEVAGCAGDSSLGPTVEITLQNQSQPTRIVREGAELIVSKRPNPQAGLLTRPRTSTGAICERAEDGGNWYFIARRAGTFVLTSNSADAVGTNANQGYDFARISVVPPRDEQ
jgi:hypothetical protein